MRLSVSKRGPGVLAALMGVSMLSGASVCRAQAEREPTPRHQAPANADVLFDGPDSLDKWRRADGSEPRWRATDTGELVVVPGTGSIMTREPYLDFTLHVEFQCPAGVDSRVRGQARSNSGVYLLRSYEVQILDSWGLDPAINGCGAIYGVRPPTVNASREPGQWQTYDIEFIAPRWGDAGEKVSDARITVRHNGVLIHDDVPVPGATGAGHREAPGPRPILLQDHGNPIRFRNIWIIPQPSWEGSDAEGFEELLPDEGLEGWTRRGGKAKYWREGDVIVGETRPNQPNTFLCTDERYRDFVLELEYLVDPELNSGIQIRSNSLPERDDGRVHGYQVEIDPSERAWSAGIYDEAGRGWLHDLEDNDAARAAFRQGEWNRVRIVAQGDAFRTYLNDVPAALLVDDATAEGFIGLQVHGVGDREDPLQVRWRDLRIREIPHTP